MQNSDIWLDKSKHGKVPRFKTVKCESFRESCENTLGRKFRNFEAIRFVRRYNRFPEAKKSLQKSVVPHSGKILILIFSIFHLPDFLEYTRIYLDYIKTVST